MDQEGDQAKQEGDQAPLPANEALHIGINNKAQEEQIKPKTQNAASEKLENEAVVGKAIVRIVEILHLAQIPLGIAVPKPEKPVQRVSILFNAFIPDFNAGRQTRSRFSGKEIDQGMPAFAKETLRRLERQHPPKERQRDHCEKTDPKQNGRTPWMASDRGKKTIKKESDPV